VPSEIMFQKITRAGGRTTNIDQAATSAIKQKLNKCKWC